MSIDELSPVSTLMMMKPVHEIRYSRWVPHRRDRYPDSGIITTSGIR